MTAAAVDDESGVADWLALVHGTTRERLIERLAQARLSGADRTPEEVLSDEGPRADTQQEP
jgi:hypothetical protein